MSKIVKVLNLLLYMPVFFILSESGYSEDKSTPLDTLPRFTAQPIIIPIEIEQNRLRLFLELNGQQVSMLLDSGATVSLLFAEAQTRFNNLPAANKTRDETKIIFPAVNQTFAGRRLAPVTLKLGNNSLTLENFILMNKRIELQSTLLDKYDGIIGQELFNKYTIEVNPYNMTVTLHPKGTDLSTSFHTRLSLFMQGTSPHIRLRSKMPWENKPTMKELLLDTGYSGSLVIWDNRHFRKAAKYEQTKHGPAKKLIETNTGIVGRVSFSIGRNRFINAPVFLGANPPFQKDDRDGVLGGNILNQYRYAIDFEQEKMWIYHKDEANKFSKQFEPMISSPNNEDYVVKSFKDESTFIHTIIDNSDAL